jgi:hypothetical protein
MLVSNASDFGSSGGLLDDAASFEFKLEFVVVAAVVVSWDAEVCTKNKLGMLDRFAIPGGGV